MKAKRAQHSLSSSLSATSNGKVSILSPARQQQVKFRHMLASHVSRWALKSSSSCFGFKLGLSIRLMARDFWLKVSSPLKASLNGLFTQWMFSKSSAWWPENVIIVSASIHSIRSAHVTLRFQSRSQFIVQALNRVIFSHNGITNLCHGYWEASEAKAGLGRTTTSNCRKILLLEIH